MGSHRFRSLACTDEVFVCAPRVAPATDAQVFGPDSNGIKTVIDYRIKEDGSKVRFRRRVVKTHPCTSGRMDGSRLARWLTNTLLEP